ncbi:hemerythrin domain-containing protein [Caulobacter hibisci]|uniref:Hemerythrin domain-containing protein n=1 Tax=Caulobacter hibisci TaxID=2035993 RepID=A0ABS0SXF2_9CAUL|nr:hemerythrin domain-containing protein [Caulobacter hibisci]MBI1684096.1 hemerythrin domain-containing protein [Caulobacter hibisci]
MSIVDKVLGAITPPESQEARDKATAKARAAATPGDWLSMALGHHGQIRSAFEQAQSAASPQDRIAALKALATVLNGHSLAEEVVLYPALAKTGEKGHAGQAYTEQTTAKMQMAELERIDPAEDAWREKLEHIQGAVLHHMFEEEGTWFLELKEKAPDQDFLTRRYAEEYGRYVFGVGASEAGGQLQSSSHSEVAEPRSFMGEADAESDLQEIGRNSAGPLQMGDRTEQAP